MFGPVNRTNYSGQVPWTDHLHYKTVPAVWTNCLSGSAVWISCLDQLSGSTVWTSCLDQLSGSAVWTKYLDQLPRQTTTATNRDHVPPQTTKLPGLSPRTTYLTTHDFVPGLDQRPIRVTIVLTKGSSTLGLIILFRSLGYT